MSPKRVSAILVLLVLASWMMVAQSSAQTTWEIPLDGYEIDWLLTNRAIPGDIIEITQSMTLHPFTLNKAVAVRAATGAEVVVDTLGSTWAAQITDAGGSITGLTLRTGSLGAVSVGSGAILGCTIEDDGDSFSTAAVTVGQGGRVEGCQVVLNSGQGRAIHVTASTTSDSTQVNDNTVALYLTSGGSYKEGIYIAGAGTVVNRNTVTVAGPDSVNGVGIRIPDASGASSKIRDNVIETAWKGILVGTPESGGVEIVRNLMWHCYHGVWLASGSDQTVDRNTVIGNPCEYWSDGIRIASGVESSASSFQNNLLTDLRYGIKIEGDKSVNWTFLNNAYASSDENCGDPYPSEFNFSIYQIRVIDYPLFCEGREGTKAYSHRIDSSAAPGNFGADEIIGVYGVECGWGTLSRSSTLCTGDVATVLEDVTVPSGLHLTLDQGTILKFDEDDNSASGKSSSKNELVVEGTLTASSNFGETQFKSAKASPAAGDWYGIVVKPGATVSFDQVTVEHAQYGIRDDQGAASATFDLDGVDFAACQTVAVYLVPNPTAHGTGSLTMTDCSVEMSGALYGVYLWNPSENYIGYDMVIDGGLISGNSSGTYGLYLKTGSLDGSADVKDLQVNDLTAGTGIYVAGPSPRVFCPTIDNCAWGIQLDGSGDPVVCPSNSSGAGLISDCTIGLYAKGSCTADVALLDIEDCATGLYTDAWSEGTYQAVAISGGTTGCKPKSVSAHTFREGNIIGFSAFGVGLAPHLGG